MKKIALAALMFGCMGTVWAIEKKIEPIRESIDPTMKVLIAKDVRGVLLEARGPYKVIKKKNGELLSYGTSGKRFVAHALSEGLRWSEEYPGTYEVMVVPTSASTTLYVDGYQYKGSMTFFSSKRGAITVINEVALEDFVKGSLSAKLNEETNPEAAQALAIVERTNGYSRIYRRGNASSSLWDATAKEVNYFGMGLISKSVDEAVCKTAHVVIQENGGAPLEVVELSLKQAKTLADGGLDAKRILRKVCPQITTLIA